MPGGGSSIFTEPDRYLASLPLSANLGFVDASRFSARLTWVELPHLRLFRMRETAPRVAYITLPPNLVFVTFPTRGPSPLIVGGKMINFGEMALHARAERFHQRMSAAGQWGVISLGPSFFESAARTLTGRTLDLPEFSKLVRPRMADRKQLFQLYAEACRIAETAVSNLGHPEVGRALEQDLLCALVTCLAEGEVCASAHADREAAEALIRCEEVLAGSPKGSCTLDEICCSVNMTERKLTAFSTEILGMTPGRYLRLRRFAPAGVPRPNTSPGEAGGADLP